MAQADLEVAYLIIYCLTGVSAFLLLTCAILFCLCFRYKKRAKQLKRLVEEEAFQLAPAPTDSLALPHRLCRSSVTEMDLNPIYNQLPSPTQTAVIPENQEYAVLQRRVDSSVLVTAETSDYATGNEAPLSSSSRATGGGGTRMAALGMSTDSGAVSGHESIGTHSTHKMAVFFSNPLRDSGRVHVDNAAGEPAFSDATALAYPNKSAAYVETSETDGEDPYTPMTHFQQSRSNENVRYRVDVPRPAAHQGGQSDLALFNWSPPSTLPNSSVSRAHLSTLSSEVSSIHPELAAKPGLADLAAGGTASFPFRKAAERREVSRASTLPASCRHRTDVHPPVGEHFRSGELLSQSSEQPQLGQWEETASYRNVLSGRGGKEPAASDPQYWNVASAENTLTRLHDQPRRALQRGDEQQVGHEQRQAHQRGHGRELQPRQEPDDWHQHEQHQYLLRPAMQAAGGSPGRGHPRLASDLRRSASVDNGQLFGIAPPLGGIGLRGRQISGLYGIAPIRRQYGGRSPGLYDVFPMQSLQNLRQASSGSDPHLSQYEYETPRFQESSAY